MNRSMMVVCAALSFVLATGTAMAADIQGRIGVTGRVGFLAPTDSEAFAVPSRLDTDIDLVGEEASSMGSAETLRWNSTLPTAGSMRIAAASGRESSAPPTFPWVLNTGFSTPGCGSLSPIWVPEWTSC